jgi:hypothetical protein
MANTSVIHTSCIKSSNGSIISVSENGKRFVINNKYKKTIEIIHVDGCAITNNAIRCDYIIIERNTLCHIIELKGKNISHALAQLSATINHFNGMLFSATDKLRCYIVCSGAPAMSASNGAKKLAFFTKTGINPIIKCACIELIAI